MRLNPTTPHDIVSLYGYLPWERITTCSNSVCVTHTHTAANQRAAHITHFCWWMLWGTLSSRPSGPQEAPFCLQLTLQFCGLDTILLSRSFLNTTLSAMIASYFGAMLHTLLWFLSKDNCVVKVGLWGLGCEDWVVRVGFWGLGWERMRGCCALEWHTTRGGQCISTQMTRDHQSDP